MTILFEKSGNGIAKITFNRPAVHNAFNEQMIADLTAAFNDLQNSDQIHIVVISGAGKSFSAGADLDWMNRAASYSYSENLVDAQKLTDMLNSFYSLKQLTIAVVHGVVMGGGLGLIACADIIVADNLTKFALSEVNLGLIPATISPFVLEAIGSRNARRYFQTGELFTAQKALSMGLIHEIADGEDQRSEIVQALLNNALKSAPQAMKMAKKLIFDYHSQPITDDLRRDSAVRIAVTRASDEAVEGLSAFFEKRKADWEKHKADWNNDV